MISNPETTIFDLAIVGAGPAGSSCAISACKSGSKSVALIDAQKFPRDKICGDGIGPGAIQIMKKLGADEILASYKKVQFLSISSPSGLTAKGPLPSVNGAKHDGYTIPRQVLDNHFFTKALEYGATDISGYRLNKASFDGKSWTLELTRTARSEPMTIKARVLVGADGARSKVRRFLGVPINSDRHTGTAARIYAKSPNGQLDALQIDFVGKLLPAYGWMFPISATQANIGIGIDLYNYKNQSHKLADLLSQYREKLNSSINYDQDTYGAFILPYGSELPKIAHGQKHAALIGDAASMINPLTGEGIYYSMFAGELLGRLLAQAQSRQQGMAGVSLALETFERQFRAKFKSHYDINWTMKEKIKSPHWCDIIVRSCARDEKILSDLIEIMMGDKNNIDQTTIFRIVARNLLPF
ncbi:hypothetical protein MNBD_ALPHA12-1979 [hydrothermal vent metagenome]|uniref:FAD-binding domain-containing protein n=1 Tax=hydrothermal vent metagenome TaxID=652676 RepID=A0A3B0TR86_9ZZZZ